MPLKIGQQLGSCEILERLGTGGMGETYCGRDTKPGSGAAVKALAGDLSSAKSQDP